MRYQLEVVQRRAGNRLGLSLKTTDGILTTECPADHNRWIILSEILCVCVCVCGRIVRLRWYREKKRRH